jgi:NAD(P)H dehydrogenase (quinone)
MKILVVYYSLYGHIHRMAEAVAEGAKDVEGAEVEMCRVPETLPQEVIEMMGAVYTFEGQERNDEITGGSPYGSSTIAGNTGERMPSENELAAARFQGKYVAMLASTLAQHRREIIDAICE